VALLSDLKILYKLVLSPISGGTHKERLESFYGGQAEGYDAFRKRLLKGRETLYRSIVVPTNGVWVDMGGGTGANLENIGPAIASMKRVYVVDLSTSLLRVAAERAAERGWKNVTPVEADVTQFVPEEGLADVVTFSYSLTMIPDWFAAIDQARRILKPGGVIGVVDFYVSRKYPDSGRRRHGWATRSFWPVWFASDNVHPSPDHLPYLSRRFEEVSVRERRGTVPYLMGLTTPYYRFVGRKPAGG